MFKTVALFAALALPLAAQPQDDPPAPTKSGHGTDHVAHGAGPHIDVKSIPPPRRGFDTERIAPTPEVPPKSDIGAFRTSCGYSHMSFDDPIVFPNQPGRSHLHAFFGNTETNAGSTATSIANQGGSTCRGGTANRTAYWVPAMIDTRNGKVVVPENGIFYYKTGYKGIDPSAVKPLPQGLRMIAGDPSNKTPTGPFSYNCKANRKTKEIPQCAAGSVLYQTISFPQCWDGVNLDSPDHRSHMAYPVRRGCPSTHPVSLPEITFRIVYRVPDADAPKHWRLSSDTYDASLPGGYSAHGDWFNGWKKEISDAWTKHCDQASVDCHSHLLGDGRKAY
jgi:hypothetical protein